MRNPKQMLFLKIREKGKTDLAEKEMNMKTASVYLDPALERLRQRVH